MKIENDHAVPKAQWKKWNDVEKRLFNELYFLSLSHQHLMVHPKASVVEPQHWKTIAWNHAWMAADYARAIRKGKL